MPGPGPDWRDRRDRDYGRDFSGGRYMPPMMGPPQYAGMGRGWMRPRDEPRFDSRRYPPSLPPPRDTSESGPRGRISMLSTFNNRSSGPGAQRGDESENSDDEPEVDPANQSALSPMHSFSQHSTYAAQQQQSASSSDFDSHFASKRPRMTSG
jgi:hypothetical protein